jgi:Protein of unknown function (DUF2793)
MVNVEIQSMPVTPFLELPLIAGAQAQKHVTHNEALDRLDMLVQTTVTSTGQNTAPASPAEGQNFIIGSAPTGLWAGQALKLASWRNGYWMFAAPREGWQVFSAADQSRLVFAAGQWRSPTERFEKLAINTSANGTDKLSVKAPATLFTHDGNDHRIKINKAATADTASLLFQNSFSGRAEFGLTGDDSFRLKTSANGLSWVDALTVDNAGKIGIGTNQPQSALELTNRPSGIIADVSATNYGTGSGGVFHGQCAAGTPEAPAAPAAGTLIAGFGGRAYHGGGAFQPHSPAAMHAIATETPSATAWGAGLAFWTTPTGTSTRKRAAWIMPSGLVWAIDGSSGWDAASAAQAMPISGSMIQASASAATGATGCTINTIGYGGVTPGFRGLSARGTNIAPSPSLAGDLISFLAAHGHDGVSFNASSSALLAMRAEALWSSTSKPTYITLETTPSGSAVRAERLRVNGAGDVGIGTAAPTTKLHVNGPIRCASFAKAALPNAATTGAGSMIYVSDDSGGAVLAFSDGVAWRRVTDRLIIA